MTVVSCSRRGPFVRRSCIYFFLYSIDTLIHWYSLLVFRLIIHKLRRMIFIIIQFCTIFLSVHFFFFFIFRRLTATTVTIIILFQYAFSAVRHFYKNNYFFVHIHQLFLIVRIISIIRIHTLHNINLYVCVYNTYEKREGEFL